MYVEKFLFLATEQAQNIGTACAGMQHLQYLFCVIIQIFHSA